MIICSCNVLTDAQVKSAVSGGVRRPRMSSIYASLGCAAKCDCCTYTIKSILDDIRQCATVDHHAIAA